MAFKATTGRDGAEGVQQQWVVGGGQEDGTQSW